jgi:GNAT superfamily N-acetyltransferase
MMSCLPMDSRPQPSHSVPSATRPSHSIGRRAPSDDEGIFRLYEEEFGAERADASRLRWRWQYLENPENGDDGAVIWVARDGERVLGQYASMPVRLFWDRKEARASWGMDVFLRPDARGLGIGAELFNQWSNHLDVALGLGLTPASYALFKKLRYHDMGPVPFYRKVLDPRAVTARYLGSALSASAGPLLASGLKLVYPESRQHSVDVFVGRIDDFGPEYDGLWERAKTSYTMCVRRDRAYLRWKYLACPHRRYDIWEARRKRELAGYAVARHEDYRGLRLGWVVDVFTHAKDHEAKGMLLAAILDNFREAGVARAQAFSMNERLGRDLRRYGFIPGGSPMQFCVRSRTAGDAPFADPGGWHVVFGDSDMDR